MLTVADFASPTWLRFKEMAAAQLAELRESNDVAVNEALTAHTRGRIAELKYWLELTPPTTPDHP